MKCPLLNRKCIQGECVWFVEFTMKDPGSQRVSVERDCVIPRLPSMLIEVIRNTAGTQEATEAVRNRAEAVAQNTGIQAKILGTMADLALDRVDASLPPAKEPRSIESANPA